VCLSDYPCSSDWDMGFFWFDHPEGQHFGAVGDLQAKPRIELVRLLGRHGAPETGSIVRQHDRCKSLDANMVALFLGRLGE
jgi:hypothetical protein